MIKGYEMVEACKKRLGWGYVLGGQGELYTKDLARMWGRARRSGKSYAYFTVTCAKWFGHRIVDCSGMIIEAFRDFGSHADQTADTLYSECTRKGSISTIPEVPGLCVWKKGHIGIYAGNGRVIESRGAAYGVVDTALKARPWTNWGYIKGVDYTAKPEAPQLKTYVCTAPAAKLYAEPSRFSKRLSKARKGDLMKLESYISGDWARVIYKGVTGYVWWKYITMDN